MRVRHLIAAMLALTPAACDLSVSNPGPVQDAALNELLAHEALVNGGEKMLSAALTRIARHGGTVAKEVTASGLVGGGNIGTPERIRQGLLNDEETSIHWQEAQKARWILEDALRRMEESLGASAVNTYLQAARASLYAGYANRLLGENMCTAVIDGGAAQDRRVYFQRAEAAFNRAGAIAAAMTPRNTQIEIAAIAGRASVRADLGNWTGAVADAAQIPTDYAFQAQYYSVSAEQYNAFAFANQNSPHRSDSVVGTFYESYFTDANDPRTPWAQDSRFPFGGPAPEGQIRWYPPRKYTQLDQPVNLATGREMRLIEAEARLIDNDVAGAMRLIDDLRTSAGVQPWPTTTSAEQAWTHLKRERGIELWLEGRRLNDLRRWTADNRPGTQEDMTGRDTCFPVPQSEKNTNPNLRGA